jgi:hypothetical protein
MWTVTHTEVAEPWTGGHQMAPLMLHLPVTADLSLTITIKEPGDGKEWWVCPACFSPIAKTMVHPQLSHFPSPREIHPRIP